MKIHLKLALTPLALALAVGCSSTELEETASSPFLVTDSSADGTVSLLAMGGTLSASSAISLINSAQGLFLSSKAAPDGSMLVSFAADPGETIQVQYTAADGTVQTEEVHPEEKKVTAHGLLTKIESGDEDGKPCWVLVRDDVDAASGEDIELLLVPPGPPPGSQPPPQGEDGSTPPPKGEDGATPPPGEPPPGGKPPPGCHPPPQDGSTPPEGSTPPPGGKPPEGSEPPEGSKPPPCGVSPATLEALEGTYVTVGGTFDLPPPPEDAPCLGAGTPFGMFTIVADQEGAGGAEMSGSVEASSTTSSATDGSSPACLTFDRSDVVDATGKAPSDLLERFALIGDKASEIVSSQLQEGQRLVITGVPYNGTNPCGFQGLKVTSYSISTSAR